MHLQDKTKHSLLALHLTYFLL